MVQIHMFSVNAIADGHFCIGFSNGFLQISAGSRRAGRMQIHMCYLSCILDYHIYGAVSDAIWLTTVYLVWAQAVAYSHAMFHHTAGIEWAQEAANSHAVFHHTAHNVVAQEAASSGTGFHLSGYIVAYSHAVFHHTARIKREQEAADSNAVCHNTADSVRAQKAAFSFSGFDRSAYIVWAQLLLFGRSTNWRSFKPWTTSSPPRASIICFHGSQAEP